MGKGRREGGGEVIPPYGSDKYVASITNPQDRNRGNTFSFLPCVHLDFKSAVTAKNDEFKGRLSAPMFNDINT